MQDLAITQCNGFGEHLDQSIVAFAHDEPLQVRGSVGTGGVESGEYHDDTITFGELRLIAPAKRTVYTGLA